MMPETVSAQHESSQDHTPADVDSVPNSSDQSVAKPPENGGRGGLDPTRYGDWEKNGRCIDF
jgi:hypothetical protein